MSETPEQRGYLSQAWLVILLALAYGGALAGVQTTLQPMIDENKRLETYRQIPALVGIAESTDAERITIEEREIEDDDGRKQKVYLALIDGQPQGWVLPAGGMGFADRIEVLIGLDPAAETITGLWVLDQKETPGLGNYITEDDFRKQFVGKRTDQDVTVVKTDPATDTNEIRALSGATISSDSVAKIVNDTIKNLKEAVVAWRDVEPKEPEATAEEPNHD